MSSPTRSASQRPIWSSRRILRKPSRSFLSTLTPSLSLRRAGTGSTTSRSLAAADTPARYVGLMGSKRKTILIYEDLVRMGLDEERLREIRSPIGLDIHARTPEEIAVSIIGEILMFRLGGTGREMKLEQHRIDRIIAKVEAEQPAAAVAD